MEKIIKRYSYDVYNGVHENTNGRYVKYDDYEELQDTTFEYIEKQESIIRWLKEQNAKLKECQCECSNCRKIMEVND